MVGGHVHGARRLLWDVALFVLVGFSVFTITYGSNRQDATYRRADRSACVRIEALKHVVRTQLIRGERTLPTLSYYKRHPDELARAKQQIAQQLREFAPIAC